MKETNEMSPHFRKAVAEINEDIAQLRGDIIKLENCKATIEDLYGGEVGGEPPRASKPRKTKAARVPREPRAAGTVSDATATATGNKPATEAFALIAAARALPEPLTAETVFVGCGLVDRTAGANKLFKWLKLGWVTKVSRGEFNRSKTFGE